MFKININDLNFLPGMSCKFELELDASKVIFLTGKNGVGKTTLLKKLYQELEHTHRVVLIEQKNISIFYDRELNKVKQILLSEVKDESARALFLRYWNLFHLNMKENRSILHLSGGEAQALKLCAALIHQGEFYLIDEPTQYFDNENKQTLLKLINELYELKRMIIIVEHDLSLFNSTPKRVLAMKMISDQIQIGDV